MGYRIEYDAGSKNYEILKIRRSQFPRLLAGCLGLFLLLTLVFWPEGAELLRDMLIPGDNAATLSALERMGKELGNGTPFSEAVTAFCREIVYGTEVFH